MMFKGKKTARSFKVLEFKDRYNKECSIQKSSLASENCIWVGINKAEPKRLETGEGWIPFYVPEDVYIETRMHITREHAGELAKVLQHFSETGNLELEEGY